MRFYLVWDCSWPHEDDPNSVVLTCAESRNAVGYQLLSGPDPHNVADYSIVVDGNSPPEVTVAALPASDTWWTVKVRDAHGSTIYADPIRVGLPAGLVTHWQLDETEGSITWDRAGDSDSVVHGDPIWQPDGGIEGGALSLDGFDDYVGTDLVLNPADGPFSVFAWVRGGAPSQVLVSQVDGANWLMIDASAGTLTTELASGGRIKHPLLLETMIADGSWHRIGLTWDGGHRSLCADEALVAEDSQTNLTACSGGLNIGCDQNLTPGTFWSSLIDDTRIYSLAVRP